ncbi:hypothetical protein Slin15195_G098480 [Septoria linicola]|uniref:Uncharacterized protein n=1 Tax=Septoria linicola TaxID=215465 RepID=A0A9Q9AWY0_9PEZI|nr:hypothetical protein Slin15195_G098480 [Septoria linicola]
MSFSTNTTSTSAAPSIAPNEFTIQGLREQIFGNRNHQVFRWPTTLTQLADTTALANATTLYPQLVTKSVQYSRTGVVKAQEIFEVIVTSTAADSANYSYTAILVSGHALTRSMAARGPKSACLVGALEGLLRVTSEALGWYTETLLGEMQNQEETDKGMKTRRGALFNDARMTTHVRGAGGLEFDTNGAEDACRADAAGASSIREAFLGSRQKLCWSQT